MPQASTGLAVRALIGLFLTLAIARYFVAPLDRFDEGLTLTKAAMTAAGRVPYRDIWTTYGPLDAYVLAAAFKLIAFNVTVERALGALVLVLFGVAAYALMRHLRLRKPIRFLMTGLLTVCPLSLGTFNSPYLAVLLGLAALLAFMVSIDRSARRWPIVCGCLVGLTSFSRPEYALALGGGLTIGYLILAVHPTSRNRRPVLGYLAGMLAGSAALWGAMIVLAGFPPIWFEIVVDATTLYARNRSIPFGGGPDAAVVIILGGASTLVWLSGMLRAVRQRADAAELARVVALLVAAVFAFTWVRTRADGIHAFEAWPLTGVLLALLIERHARRRPLAPPRFEAIASIVGILLFCIAAGSLTLRDFILPHAPAGIARAGLVGERAWIPSAELAEVIREIDAQVPAAQPIWVGLQRNDLVVFNDTTIYFLSGRNPGTAYYEALPGVTNTDTVERTIACQLASSGVSLVVLGPNTAPEPWNLSSVPGSTYMDQWIAARTVSRREIGPYSLLRLRPGVEPADRCPSSGAAALYP
ncbi:MAG: glycosyltransferase family 39 protein, partial [Candidatus Dormibacteraeota bacterium]|nr:glycosyltransferase family 39 protein [Candidatus Dormibacteraeota bacterium]